MCLEHTVLDGTSIIAELDDCERSWVLVFPPLRPLYNVILQELYGEMMPSSSPLESKLTVRLASANGNSARWSACGGLTRTCTCQQACSPAAFGPHHILAHMSPMFSKYLSFPLVSSRFPGPEFTPFPLLYHRISACGAQTLTSLSLSIELFSGFPTRITPQWEKLCLVRVSMPCICLRARHWAGPS